MADAPMAHGQTAALSEPLVVDRSKQKSKKHHGNPLEKRIKVGQSRSGRGDVPLPPFEYLTMAVFCLDPMADAQIAAILATLAAQSSVYARALCFANGERRCIK